MAEKETGTHRLEEAADLRTLSKSVGVQSSSLRRRFLRYISRTLTCFVLVAFSADAATATSMVLGRTTSFCISIFDLARDHEFEFRDDISQRLASELSEQVQKLHSWIRVYSRQRCLKENDFRYQTQASLDLYIKRQTAVIDAKMYNVAVLGGSSPNTLGPLSEYELQPIVLIQTEPISDDQLESALMVYVQTRVFNLIPR